MDGQTKGPSFTREAILVFINGRTQFNAVYLNIISFLDGPLEIMPI